MENTIFMLLQLTYPEFPFESEAKGDSLIGVHQTKTVQNWKDAYNFTSSVALGIKWLWEYFYTDKEAKGLNNRYCVKFMQFDMGLYNPISDLQKSSKQRWST